MKKTVLFIIAASVGSQVLAADVTTFDIAGVKLGMNPTEAKSALRTYGKALFERDGFAMVEVWETDEAGV
jgi:hypothetical protein